MGFSVSGSAAIIFAGMFIAFGMWFTAASNGFERVTEAQHDHTEDVLAQQNTDVVVDSAVLDTNVDEMRVRVTNRGASALSLNDTDVLVDNVYYGGWQASATVDSTKDTYLWLPGEQLEFNVSVATAGQVKVVTGTGVADTAVVTQT